LDYSFFSKLTATYPELYKKLSATIFPFIIQQLGDVRRQRSSALLEEIDVLLSQKKALKFFF